MTEGKKQGSPTRTKNRAARAADAKSSDAPARKSAAPPSQRTVIAAAGLALVAGAALGWFGRGAAKPAEATVRPEPRPAGSAADVPAASGPCGEWSAEVCKRAGDQSEGCMQAKAASELLTAPACVAARTDLDATIAKLQAARSSCDELTEKLCGDLGKDSKTCGMVREKTPSFPTARCKQMLSEYDGVLAELKAMEKAEAPLSQDLATRQASGEAPGFGSPDAKVKVVVYTDFECPFCSRAAEVVDKLREKYESKVRFVYRQYPLPMHANAPLAAEAALAAHAQGKFWPLHDMLFENQRSLDRASLEQYATKAGLDMPKFTKALDDHTYAATVKSDMKLGEEAGVNGTPSMFIGTERVSNPTDFDAVARQIDAKLAN
jgi:protein-disulfide isomerase